MTQRSRVEDRMQSEIGSPAEAEAIERFKAEHDGLTPLQSALHTFPSVRDQVEEAEPRLRPSKQQLDGPAIPTAKVTRKPPDTGK